MLTISVQGTELWDYEAEVFRYTEDVVLRFEHSLVSVSKWEAKFHKPFLTNEKKTEEEMYGYVKAMLLDDDVPDDVFERLTEEQALQIDAYINDPMTGTTISELPRTGPRTSEQLSAELIYFWMSQYQIDKDCENWHLNRLFTLIKVHHAKSQKQKKVPRQKQIQTMAEINAARRKQLGTSG